MTRRPDAHAKAASSIGRVIFRRRRDRGFALIAAIWSLGLITLLGLTLIVGARYRAKTSSDYLSMTATELAAESAVNLTIGRLLSTERDPKYRYPLSCVMPEGETATIMVEDENGKVDLNTASPQILTRFFTGLTQDQSEGMRLSARVVEFRERVQHQSQAPSKSPGQSSDQAQAASPAPAFATTMQLDEVGGLPAPILKAALRLVTVHSGRTEPDMDAAVPALRRLFALAPKNRDQNKAVAAGASVTIRADVKNHGGGRFVREALVSLGVQNGRPFTIREWRHGDVGPYSPSSAQDPAMLTPCIPFAPGSSS